MNDGINEPDAEPESRAAQGANGGSSEHEPADGTRDRDSLDGPGTGDGSVTEEEAFTEAETEQLQRNNLVVNNFYSDVDATGARFGVSVERSFRRATGQLDPDEVRTALRVFVEPPPYSSARAALSEYRLVVLHGKDGIGKRLAAVALLHELVRPRLGITSLSPLSTVADLADKTYQQGRGYLVQDRVVDSSVAAAKEFHLERLLRRLKEHRAYLVITASSAVTERRHRPELVKAWEAPGSYELFDACLATFGSVVDRPQDLAKLRERAGEMTSPRDIVAFAQRVSDGPDAALASQEDSERARVSEWFDARPDQEQLLLVTTLAFAYGLPLRAFEAAHARLRQLAERPGSSLTEPSTTDVKGLSQQARGDMMLGHDLVCVTEQFADDPEHFGVERRLVFKADTYRACVVAQLHDRYGFALWEPLRVWINELARYPLSEIHMQVAMGLALLGRRAFGEVRDSFLHPFSNGTAPERATAAYILGWMCIDDNLAPVALRTALGWTKNCGIRRAVTAALALSGPLGIRYQTEALRHLWLLSLRGEPARSVARRSLAWLFAATVEEPAVGGTLLRFLRARVRRGLHEGPRVAQLTLAVVITVLSVERLDRGEPVVAHMLRTRPENADILGDLWAALLGSARCWAQAVDTLRRVLESLDGDTEARTAVTRLGEAVRGGISAERCDRLRTSFERTLSRTRNPYDSRGLIYVLLKALGDGGR